MNKETRTELDRTTRIAEALFKALEEKNIEDQLAHHHIRNSVTGVRGIEEEDTDEEIMTFCKETQERLRPFLYLLKP